MTWKTDFPSFDVPPWVDQHPDLDDQSDRYSQYVMFLDDVFQEAGDADYMLVLWVDHPDRHGWGTRYAVNVEHVEGESWPIVETDDEVIARAALAWMRQRVLQLPKPMAGLTEAEYLFNRDGTPRDPSVTGIDLRDVGKPQQRHPWGIRRKNENLKRRLMR